MDSLRFWGSVGAAALLAALVLVAAATAATVADSAIRLVVAFAIPLLAGLAVTGSAAAAEEAVRPSRRERRTR